MKEMKKMIFASMFAFLLIASMLFMPINPASAQSSSWTKVSDVRGDSTLYVEYKTTDWDSSKKTCRNVILKVTNKYSKSVMNARVITRFKNGRDAPQNNITALEAGKPVQFTIPSDKGGCIVEKVTFESVKVSDR